MINQKRFTEDVLFKYYMPSNIDENSIHSQIPFYLDSNTYDNMVYYSEIINNVCLDIMQNLNTKHKRLISYIDDFPLKERIFNLKCDFSPLLWTRFDTFRDSKGHIKFAEINYDKPCAQKEIGLAGSMDFEGNVNGEFEEKMVKSLKNVCVEYCKGKHNTEGKGLDEKINIAFLIDPCHYEELHVAYYLKALCQDTRLNILQVGPQNLSVKDSYVYAFERNKVDVILRLFPTEFLYEVNDIGEIFDCFEKSNVLILNDPRILAIQAKSLFAYLWELVESDSVELTREWSDVIKKCIPYTCIFDKNKTDIVLKNKDNYVVKASLGRYSGEVYIGRLFSDIAWKDQIGKVIENKKIHIIQNVIDIKKEYTYCIDKNLMNVPCIAYGNFGTFLLGDKVEGICVRWSTNFLTDNSTTWMAPIGKKDYGLNLLKYEYTDRKQKWDKITEKAIFDYNFTGQYSNTDEYISLNSMVLDKTIFNEINDASIKYCTILRKTSELIKNNFDSFSELLGIPAALKNLILNSYTDAFCAVGRIDFVMDNEGKLKILEINSETPAGLVESVGIQNIIHEDLSIPYININENLKENIKKSFEKILDDFSKKGQMKNIGFVCTSYFEDWYNTEMLMKIINESGKYNLFLGNVYDIKVKDNKLHLYGNELDAVYRYFPLDWLATDIELKDVFEALNKKTFSINPTHTIITQSKAIYCVIYELLGKGFFLKGEEDFIRKYIPYSCFEPDENLPVDCMAKPCLSREGKGIVMSYEGIDRNIKDVILQERINTKPFEMMKHKTVASENRFLFPVLGVYITGDKPSGIYTRMGDFVTNERASYVATFLK
ncbi:MAG: glutathionylspermidine synthase family protein [Solirubrobacterales bacterium]